MNYQIIIEEDAEQDIDVATAWLGRKTKAHFQTVQHYGEK